MRFLLNLAWLILGGGLVIFLEYLVGGLLLCLTIVGLPFGAQCWKLAGLGLWPFGKRIEHDASSAGGGCLGAVMNVVWFLVAGVWIFLSHLVIGVTLAVTIIGIPFALQHLKFATLALSPFGKRIVDDR
ncbi:MAG: YccF domain-containing protein [Deltaproteobacteria bacterium]|nr:YccF domain-containing protein [Deltaproteobacteria bacterium]